MPGKKSHTRSAKVQKWSFELYIAGQTPRSLQAIANLKLLCEKNLKEHYELKIIDVSENPTLARIKQLIALPTLIRLEPQPERIVVGDLSEMEKTITILGMQDGKQKK